MGVGGGPRQDRFIEAAAALSPTINSISICSRATFQKPISLGKGGGGQRASLFVHGQDMYMVQICTRTCVFCSTLYSRLTESLYNRNTFIHVLCSISLIWGIWKFFSETWRTVNKF
jgi:hypothetical protein